MTAEDAIRAVLAARAEHATACPPEAARLLGPDGWRDRRDEVRGPIRLRPRP